MSLNRDKESDKEIEFAQLDRIAKIKEFALTPEEAIEKIVENIVEVEVDNPKLTKEIEQLHELIGTAAEKNEKLNLDVQGLEDIIFDKNAEINALRINMEAATVTISEYKGTKKDNELIIKKQSEQVLKLKKAVKELST